MSQRGRKRKICWFSWSTQAMLREDVAPWQYCWQCLWEEEITILENQSPSWKNQCCGCSQRHTEWIFLNSCDKLKYPKLPLQFYPWPSQLLLRLLGSLITFFHYITYKSMCCGYFPYCTTPNCMLLLVVVMMIVFFTLFLPKVNILYVSESTECTLKKSSLGAFISFSIHTK